MTLLLDHPERVFIEELRGLGRGELYIDVGSHVGWYVINLADLYDEVWAVEPYKPYADGLRENLKKYGITNVTIITKAVSDKAGTADFYGNIYALEGRDCPSLKSDLNLSFEGRYKPLPIKVGQVEVVTLTELIGVRHVDLVKVDTEGNELEVLWGSLAVMPQINAFHIEVHNWLQTPAIKSLLEFYGFKVKERGMDWREQGWLIATK